MALAGFGDGRTPAELTIRAQPRWRISALLPIATGALWVLVSASFGLWALLYALIPATVMLATGFSLLCWAGSLRIQQFMALGGFNGAVLGLLSMIWLGVFAGLVLAVLSLACAALAGRVALEQEPVPDHAPHPKIGLALALKAALDDALLAWFTTIARVPTGAHARRVAAELSVVDDLSRGQSRPDDPTGAPPVLENPGIDTRRQGRYTFERVCFESGYQPDPDMPGADRWAGFTANRTAYAWMLRHPGPPRPWVIGIHGYRMGSPLIDLTLFKPAWLFESLGFNVLVPVLPLHGPRRAGLISGDFFLDGDVINLVHAESQAMWDIRRLMGWLQTAFDAPRFGVLGYSLGGYNAALLASIDLRLDCVVAGIPATNLAQLQWRHMPEMPLRYLASLGADAECMERVYQRVSPLAVPCRVPWAGRFMFAGTADRLVPADQILALWRHWDEPLMCWYDGGHLTFRGRPEVRRFISRALCSRLWPDPDAQPSSPAADRSASRYG